MSSPEANTKIQMLQNSLKCFVFGLLSLIPILGFGFGIAALRMAGHARVAERQLWNAAKPYRIIGVWTAALSMIFWTFITILVVWRIMNPDRDN